MKSCCKWTEILYSVQTTKDTKLGQMFDSKVNEWKKAFMSKKRVQCNPCMFLSLCLLYCAVFRFMICAINLLYIKMNWQYDRHKWTTGGFFSTLLQIPLRIFNHHTEKHICPLYFLKICCFMKITLCFVCNSRKLDCYSFQLGLFFKMVPVNILMDSVWLYLGHLSLSGSCRDGKQVWPQSQTVTFTKQQFGLVNYELGAVCAQWQKNPHLTSNFWYKLIFVWFQSDSLWLFC